MSGRDLRVFLSEHRAGTLNLSKDEGLASKYLTGSMGFGGRGIQQVDYSQLLARAKAHRVTARDQQAKLKSLSKQGEGFKGAWLLRLHQEVWQHEWVRLVSERRRLEVDGEEWRVSVLIGATENGAGSGWMRELTEYIAELYQDDTRKPEQDTLHDLQLLRADLKNWVMHPGAERDHTPQLSALQQRLNRMNLLLQEQREALGAECLAMWKDVKQFHNTHLSEEGVTREVPTSVCAMECSNAPLKTSLMKEFENLDQHYQLILQQLADRHSQALSCEFGGLSEEEAERFHYIMGQYPTSLKRRRTVYLDRLSREFPLHTRKHLVEHETWYLSMHHYHRQREAYLRDRLTHHNGLEVKVRSALEDYAREMAVKEVGQVAMAAQTLLCRVLHQKVSTWREEKEVLLAAQAKQEAALQLEEQRRRLMEEDKKKQKQKRTKVELDGYRREKEQREAEQEVWLENLRAETEQLRREKAVEGEGRVEYRKEQHVKKLHRQKECLEERAKQEILKERQLAALREQVKVNVTSDPKRVYQQTLSVQAHMTSDPDVPIQQTLFPIHGFTAHKVTSDPRIRLEEALRKVGLHDSEYARHMMAMMQARTAPRPDQQSSLFQSKPSSHSLFQP